MGTIFIRELPIDCVIGVHPFERASRQRLLVSVELETNFHDAARDDSLRHSVDYVSLADRIEQIAVSGRFQLIETLAERVADALFDDRMTRLEVEVCKPAALPRTRHVGVRTRRPLEDNDVR